MSLHRQSGPPGNKEGAACEARPKVGCSASVTDTVTKSKKELRRRSRVVLYQLLNATVASRKHCLGYELAITSQSGRIERPCSYEAQELRWALAGFETLVDAQARNVLSQRSAWKPYDARSRVAACPRIESSALGDARDVGAKDSLVAQNCGGEQ
jgi:hypothetical protein